MARYNHIVSEDISAFNSSPGLKVLDLFSCSGVGAEGYLQAGARVLGVDNLKPSYYPDTFLLHDALTLAPDFVRRFNFVHASPPCQGYSVTKGLTSNRFNMHLDLISQVRSFLVLCGVPAIIENVPQAPIAKDFLLCGSMFGLKDIFRHRAFECVNWQAFYSPLFCNHPDVGVRVSIAGSFKGSKHEAAASMGCYASRSRWELCQGIPPAYTKFIFQTWLASLTTAQVKCSWGS